MTEVINLDNYRQKRILLAEVLGHVSNIVCDVNGEPAEVVPIPQKPDYPDLIA